GGSAGDVPGPRSFRDALILLAIVAIAVFVRLYRLDLTWFFLDQVRDLTTAADIASGRTAPLLGPYGGWTQGYLGPLYYYLFAVPALFTAHPLGPVVFLVLCNVFTVLLLHRLASHYFGAPVAIVACALFAVFPLAVISSRILWNPGLVPLFTMLFMQ